MSKEITIKNKFVQATISSHAAEVISFRKVNSTIETIWSRNPQHWRNCNPLLFPYTGPLKDGKYTYEDESGLLIKNAVSFNLASLKVSPQTKGIRLSLNTTSNGEIEVELPL